MLANHIPVMIGEMLEVIAVEPGAIYIDATYGAGHYSRALLDAGAGRVIALDRDPAAVARARARAALDRRLEPVESRFGAMGEAVRDAGNGGVSGIVFDLGVSSLQLDDPDRGFSIARDGPLDMRMGGGRSAESLVNEASEEDLSSLIWRYGEEPAARRIARAIVATRRARPIRRTHELAALVSRVAGGRRAGHHPATRTFQALRIAVNDELGELERGLAAAQELLAAPGGRLAVVAFHSLEDRIVKRFLNERSGRGGGSRHRPAMPSGKAVFRLLTRGALRPSAAEVAHNPRARSARLRAAERQACGRPS